MSNLSLSTFVAKNLTALGELRSSAHLATFPGLGYTFEFEHWLMARLDAQNAFIRHHPYLPVGLAIAYYIGIVRLLPRLLESHPRLRPGRSLRVPLVLWNAALAIFSIMGTVRVLPEVLWTWRHFGLQGSACRDQYFDDPRYFLWFHLFAFSKVVEFGDTMFLVLRGHGVILLHWVHHMLTLVYCWHSLVALPAHSRWLCAMNYVIHSFMYTYYALVSARVKVPRHWAQHLTTAQIAQMLVGLGMQTQALWLGEHRCRVPKAMAVFGFSMYAIFLTLFLKLFVDKYVKGNNNNTGYKHKKA